MPNVAAMGVHMNTATKRRGSTKHKNVCFRTSSAKWARTALFLVPYRCFGTAYRPLGCLETSVRKDQYSVRDNRSAVLTKMLITIGATIRFSKQIKLSSYQLD